MIYNVFRPGSRFLIENLIKRRILLLTMLIYTPDSPRLYKWFVRFSSFTYDLDELIFMSGDMLRLAKSKNLLEYYESEHENLWVDFYTRFPVNYAGIFPAATAGIDAEYVKANILADKAQGQ